MKRLLTPISYQEGKRWPLVSAQLNHVKQLGFQFSSTARNKPANERARLVRHIFRNLEAASLLVHCTKEDLVKCSKKAAAVRDNGNTSLEIGTFAGVLLFYEQKCNGTEEELNELIEFISKILPCIITLALNLESSQESLPANLQSPEFLSGEYPDLAMSSIRVYEASVSRSYVASLLAMMFLCLTPDVDKEFDGRGDYLEFFDIMHGDISRRVPEISNSEQCERLKMVLEYFKRISVQGVPPGFITYRKLVGEALPTDLEEWKACDDLLCDFEVKETGSIFDMPSEVIQTDFANQYIGGGVLGHGNVQEEIMFTMAPELQTSILFVGVMLPNEAIQILGFETFSEHTGYGFSLKHGGPLQDPVTRAADGTPSSYLAAIDALKYSARRSLEQYQSEDMLRELNKALVGFHQPRKQAADNGPGVGTPAAQAPAELRPIATGNWGSGVFGGDPQLKSMLQWMAASRAKCPRLIYYTFGDERVANGKLAAVVKKLGGGRVSDLIRSMVEFYQLKTPAHRQVDSLFEFLMNHNFTNEEHLD